MDLSDQLQNNNVLINSNNIILDKKKIIKTILQDRYQTAESPGLWKSYRFHVAVTKTLMP